MCTRAAGAADNAGHANDPWTFVADLGRTTHPRLILEHRPAADRNRLIGDTYLVNGSVQIFNGTGWTNAGPIVGPAGVDGIQVFSTRAAAINGAPLLNTNVPNLVIRNMTALEVRQRNVNTAGTDPLFSTGDGWGITLRLNMNDMFIPVSAVGGTANAITATFPPALTNSVGTRLSIIPIAANTGPATLNGVQLRDMNGAVLSEGALMPGRVYQSNGWPRSMHGKWLPNPSVAPMPLRWSTP